MADIVEIVTKEHASILELLTEIEASGTPDEDIFEEILDRMSVSNVLEPEILFNTLEQYAPSLVQRARNELGEVDGLLQDLADLHPSDDAWMDDFISFAALVREHFDFEEQSLLPVLTDKVPPDELSELGQTWEDRQAEEIAALEEEIEEEAAEIDEEELE